MSLGWVMKTDIQVVNKLLKEKKRDYGDTYFLLEETASKDPFQQFLMWAQEALQTISVQEDPCAMVLATRDALDRPDVRMLLLQHVEPNRFFFFTHYESNKGKQLELHPEAALNFYWPVFARQVKIRGNVYKVPQADSEAQFLHRSRDVQLSLYAWRQDEELNTREDMQRRLVEVSKRFENKNIPAPHNWGGYFLEAEEYEFFQGRQWRFHDRLSYRLKNKIWERVRLAP